MIKQAQEYLNLKQAAEYLGIGGSTAKRIWPSWIDHGVVPSRFPGNKLRFKRSELDRMMDLLRVVNK